MVGTHLYFAKHNSKTYLKDILISLGHTASAFGLPSE